MNIWELMDTVLHVGGVDLVISCLICWQIFFCFRICLQFFLAEKFTLTISSLKPAGASMTAVSLDCNSFQRQRNHAVLSPGNPGPSSHQWVMRTPPSYNGKKRRT